MAIILPDAVWAPFSGKSTTPLRHDILCAHTEVGTNEGSISIGAQAGHSYAHCYTDCLGVTWQCQDLAYRAAANLDGNPYVISWETEDMDTRCFAPWGTSCGNVPAWTAAQVDRLILDMAWCCLRFNIPPVLIPDTKAGRRGLGYHRQGVPGSPEWVVGSLAWSSAAGKCCPDWRRIEQFVNLVIPGVQRIVWGTPPVEEIVIMDPTVVQEPTFGKACILYPSREYMWMDSWEALRDVVSGYEGVGIDVEYNGRQTIAGVANVPAPRSISAISFNTFKPARPGIDDAAPPP